MEQFTPAVVEKVSKAAKSLCMWVRAMDVYSEVYKQVAPKKQKLQEAEENLQVHMLGCALLLSLCVSVWGADVVELCRIPQISPQLTH